MAFGADDAALIALIGTIVSLVSGAAKGVSSGVKKKNTEAEKSAYEKRLLAAQQKEEKKQVAQVNKDTRKAAISRAINSQNVVMPTPKRVSKIYEPFKADDTDIGSMVGGIGEQVGAGMSGVANMALGGRKETIDSNTGRTTVYGDFGRKVGERNKQGWSDTIYGQ